MDKINVKLLNYTPILVLIEALKMPYKNEKADLSLAEKVIKVKKHESVAEHITMNFLIDGSSRLELQEHMRHRLASTTCESTRYTLQCLVESLENTFTNKDDMMDAIDEYFVQPMFVDSKWDLKNGQEPVHNYNMFCSNLDDLYSYAIKFIKEWKDFGVENDYLKYGIPEGYRTRFVWTLNLRVLKNFFNLRIAPSAHFEINHVANLIRQTLKNTYIETLI